MFGLHTSARAVAGEVVDSVETAAAVEAALRGRGALVDVQLTVAARVA